MKVNYIDMGLWVGAEITAMKNTIFPALKIDDYRIYGFEAAKENFVKLPKYNDDRIRVFHKAIGNVNGKIKLYHCNKGNKGHSIYKTKRNVSEENFEEVDCVILSDWIKENVPDFEETFNILRMNIEGAEWEVFKSLEDADMIKYVNVFAGSHGNDVDKVRELSSTAYRDLIERNKIERHMFRGKEKEFAGFIEVLRRHLT